MNFWLLAFGISYPPEIVHPRLRIVAEASGALTRDIVGLLTPYGKHFFTPITGVRVSVLRDLRHAVGPPKRISKAQSRGPLTCAINTLTTPHLSQCSGIT